MKFYQDINLKPQPEISLYFLLSKVFQQIHIALAENKANENSSAIGISFPDYDAGGFLLGCRLRLFAPVKSDLEKLQCEKWLSRLRDYLQWNEISPVPEIIDGYACFRNVKLKGSKEKLARRRAKRKGETFEQALSYYSNYEEELSRLPYINMNSLTNGEHFRLFIEKEEKEQPQVGVFSCYGLSRSTTVPIF